MSFLLGVVLFAVGIGVSVALHEAGHLVTAKAFGMKVTRYFIGFGPKIFSFRRGETEYGLKAIPAGGFCQIVGMTALEEVDPADAPRAFWRQRTWKRVVVLSAGSVTHFLLGIIVLFVLAVTFGLPNAIRQIPVIGEVSACAPATEDLITGALSPCGPADPAPARAAGLAPGDEIVSVGGHPVRNWTDVAQATRALRGPTPVVVDRNGSQLTLKVDVATVQRAAVDPNGNLVLGPDGKPVPADTGALGIAFANDLHYGPISAISATFRYTGVLFADTWQGLKQFPQKIPGVLNAVTGGQRDLNGPISVVGISRIGGQAAELGLWQLFLYLLAALNFFVGVFNLLPLLPLDGGHILVALYERLRNAVRRMFGRPAGGPVDYRRLLPITYAFILVFGSLSLLLVTADIINPIQLGAQ